MRTLPLWLTRPWLALGRRAAAFRLHLEVSQPQAHARVAPRSGWRGGLGSSSTGTSPAASLTITLHCSFNEIRQLLTTAESGPLWTEVSPYHFRSRRSSSANGGWRSRALSAAQGDESPRRSREGSTVRIAETQTAVLTALKTTSNDEEAYKIVHTYVQRKMLAGKDAYWAGYKTELVERDVKGDDQFPDVGPMCERSSDHCLVARA